MNASLLLVALGLILLILILYTYMREQDTTKKIIQIAKSVDNLKREFFRYKRNIDQNENSEEKIYQALLKKIEIYLDEQKDILNSQKFENNGNIDSSAIEQLHSNLEHLRFEFEQFRENAQVRIYSLESAMKDTILERSFGNVDKTQQIIALAEQGFSHDEIQQRLRISQREIDFVLKIANYNNR